MSNEQFLERLGTLASDPRRALRALRTRLHRVPYALGLTSLWPGSFLAYTPDRYSANAAAAVRESGLSLFRNTAGFLHHNRVNNAGDLVRFYLFNLIFEQMVREGIAGDLAELGVYKGNTAVLLADFGRATGRTTHLFDTFQGFSNRDMQGIDADKEVKFRDTSLRQVRALVGSDRVNYVVGHFPGSTATINTDLSFSLVHLDCDLYAPMRAGLEYFYPRVVSGGFLVLHDYSSLHWDGAQRAVDEFLGKRPERLIPIPDKSGTAVIRKL